MKLGIIGSGNIGATVARLAVESGHEVMLSNSRGAESLAELVSDIGPGASAGTPEEAARFGEVVLEAIPFGRYETLPAAELAGKVVISASNYYPNRDGEIALESRTETELIAEHLGSSRVVKAFNTIWSGHLESQGDTAKEPAERRAIFLAGDDADAKAAVAELISELGFAPVDTGDLRAGGRLQQPGSEIYNADITAAEAAGLLSGGA